MIGVVAQVPAYRKLAGLQLRATVAYRSSLVGGLAVVLLRIALLNAVWTAAYGGRPSVDGVELPGLLTFLTLANLQLMLMRPMLVWYIQRRIHDGQIALDLVRPAPLLGQLFAQQVGATAGLLPFVVLGVPFAMLLGNLAGPASPASAVAYLVSLALAYLISVLIGLLMGLLAFWTVQSQGVGVIYEFAAQFFGGALIPLMFFPPLLLGVARVLPFQAQVTIPVSIYTGAISSAGDLAAAFALQMFWVVALAFIAGGVWRYARRVVTVHGG
ncbi:MAG: viologen exporter family transport system permease protein [Chloroflexota bacterium]|nr:viologen exporter family transport system permease protein [Chloroflexota bacterium]